MARGKILVVDDEPKIVRLVRAYLERDGFEVIEAADGRRAVEVAQSQSPDLIILDVMLPELDGLEACRQIRRFSDVPVIMLTARDEDADKLVGLELGADDYITKPFSPGELAARVRAVLRRARPHDAEAAPNRQIIVGELTIDEERFEATCHGQPLQLTPTEFRILAALARDAGRVLSRAQLLDLAFGDSFDGYDRTIDAHVKNLRRKLAAAGAGTNCGVATVHGVGYKMITGG